MKRYADIAINMKQMAEYLDLMVDTVRKQCQRKQLLYHFQASLP